MLSPGIRPARLEEMAAIVLLEHRVWREIAASTEELKRRFLFFPQGFLVAAAGSDILGFCCAALTDQDAAEATVTEMFPPRHVPRGPYFFLFGLTVDPVFRRKGIASSLVSAEVEVAREAGCTTIQLIANALSRPLFEKHAFQALRPMDHLYAQHPDLMPDPVLMQLALGASG